jgi:hypothetical protein
MDIKIGIVILQLLLGHLSQVILPTTAPDLIAGASWAGNGQVTHATTAHAIIATQTVYQPVQLK